MDFQSFQGAVTGIGGALAVSYLFIKHLKEENQRLASKNEQNTERLEKLVAQSVELHTLTVRILDEVADRLDIKSASGEGGSGEK